MDPLILALGPVFAAGLVIQQLLELLDWPISKVCGDNKTAKSYVMSLAALFGGLAVSWGFGLYIFDILLAGSDTISIPIWLDVLATALIVSGGTEGTNSIVKFLGYTKEKNKGEAAEKTGQSLKALDAQHL